MESLGAGVDAGQPGFFIIPKINVLKDYLTSGQHRELTVLAQSCWWMLGPPAVICHAIKNEL